MDVFILFPPGPVLAPGICYNQSLSAKAKYNRCSRACQTGFKRLGTPQINPSCRGGLRARFAGMSTAYYQALDAIIQHVEALQERGVRFIPIAPETLARLREPPPVAVPAGPARSVPSSFLSATPAPPPAPAAPPPPLAASPALSLEARTAAMDGLRRRVLACVKCPRLAAARRNVVFGVGALDARLMFVGEAPGADEDAQGEPFVGRAGELLTKIIRAMGLTREAVYIGNILKCRPDTPGQASGNRKPTPEEMQTCLPYLHEQIDVIRPEVIVALGATAVEGLLGRTAGITRIRGQWHTYRGTLLMPTYHPAYLLRKSLPAEKRRVWEDMLQVMERLRLPISEKQRNFFLKELPG